MYDVAFAQRIPAPRALAKSGKPADNTSMVRSLTTLFLLLAIAMPANAVTSYSAMAGRLADLGSRSELVKVYNVGKATSGDRSIWLAAVRDPNVDALNTTRILVLCRQHGDEPVSTEAALGLLDRIGAGTAPGAREALKHTSLYIVPMVNPDGADALTRRNARGIDLNRDWGRFDGVETQAAYRVFKAVRPQFVIDMHSWDKEDPYRANCLEGPRDGSELGQAVRSLEERAKSEVGEGTGQPLSEIGYDRSTEGTLCHRFMFEQMRTPSLLFETTAGMDEGPEFTKRVDLARNMMLWMLRDTAANPDSWHRLASDANPPTPRPTFALGTPVDASGSLARQRERAGVRAPVAATPTREPFRLPRTVWWAFGMYAAVALCVVMLRNQSNDAGGIRIERDARGGISDYRAVYRQG